MIYSELVWLFFMVWGKVSVHIFSIYISSNIWTIYWKDFPFSTAFSWHLYWNSFKYFKQYMNLLLDSLFQWFSFLFLFFPFLCFVCVSVCLFLFWSPTHLKITEDHKQPFGLFMWIILSNLYCIKNWNWEI